MAVLTVTEFKAEIPAALKRFRTEGASAAVVIFGAHRTPEAALIPFDLYEVLLPILNADRDPL